MKSRFLVASAAMVAVAGFLMSSGPLASAKVPVEVRVVTFRGEILAQRSVRTGTTTVETSRRATCLGGKPTDDRKRVEGATALGALVDLGRRTSRLDPLLLSGAFDFGIGLCGVGRAVATGKQWWALKVNGKLATTGGDTTRLERDDRVLWYLDRSYEKSMPDELRLSAAGSSSRSALRVRVQALNSEGKSSPAGGAKVYLGGRQVGTTDRGGRVSVRVPNGARGSESLVARLPGHIPSNRVEVENGS